MRMLAKAIMIGATATAVAQGRSQAGSNQLLHIETSFDVVVHASYAATAPLFGPQGERLWAGEDWNPKFIYPAPGRDVQGAVFTVDHEPLTAVWIITEFDVEARHFQYVYTIPGILVTMIDVRFNPVDEQATKVSVTYRRTATSVSGNGHVASMSEGDKHAGAEWQQAIDAYLAGRRSSAKP